MNSAAIATSFRRSNDISNRISLIKIQPHTKKRQNNTSSNANRPLRRQPEIQALAFSQRRKHVCNANSNVGRGRVKMRKGERERERRVLDKTNTSCSKAAAAITEPEAAAKKKKRKKKAKRISRASCARCLFLSACSALGSR